MTQPAAPVHVPLWLCVSHGQRHRLMFHCGSVHDTARGTGPCSTVALRITRPEAPANVPPQLCASHICDRAWSSRTTLQSRKCQQSYCRKGPPAFPGCLPLTVGLDLELTVPWCRGEIIDVYSTLAVYKKFGSFLTLDPTTLERNGFLSNCRAGKLQAACSSCSKGGLHAARSKSDQTSSCSLL